ncbi:BNR repeat-containing protein [Cellvibrio sp. NN19]|uniref:BNR repeat-containing protein n=1 Tax=Cellvibrio chitinivorans TaxID=3102792 RepID=UPI002B4179F2|nr:BNR repeat-containing protein [Cellvibrio sp. NN19]
MKSLFFKHIASTPKALSTTVIWLGLLLGGCNMTGSAQQANIQIFPIASDGFAGSSVNVLAGVKQTLFTSSNYQYAAYYNGNAHLVLAKRSLSQHEWQIHTTEFTGNVNDAHNHISLVVDGDGYLHIAWDHHNSQLKYAQAVAPGSLQLKQMPMLAKSGNEGDAKEASVTYPQFYRLNDGALLFAYRDGGSGQGNLVLNRYDLATKRWQRLHNSLIDGEGKRSAYWDMTLDKNNVLHLAWIWRDTPDVASNHDIAYARSLDNGQTWQDLSGQGYQIPINATNAKLAKRIPTRHKLMNPPVVAADDQSNPFIASYWANSPSDIPRYHVIYSTNRATWSEVNAPEPAGNFELGGMGTKNPPISRAVLLVQQQPNSTALHLIYRDDFNKGQVIAQSLSDITKPQWNTQVLVHKNMGAWEPSLDIAMWHQQQQASLLLQQVGQNDGNDAQSLQLAPKPIELLTWKP